MFKNKLKIAATVVVILAGMTIYKMVFDKREAEKELEKRRSSKRNVDNDIN